MSQTLKTRRLRLRRPVRDDAERLAELLNNYNVAANLAQVSLPYTPVDTNLWLPKKIAATEPDETGFVIEHKTDIVGMVSFRRDGTETILGYWLGEPYWGQGIMSEAVTAALKWYFSRSKTNMVTSGVFHFNLASLAILQKLGFIETGRSEVHCLARKAYIAHIDTQLTSQAFEAATK